MSLTSWRRHFVGLSILRVLRPPRLTSYEFFLHHLTLSPGSPSISAMKPDTATRTPRKNNYRGTSPTISTNRTGGEERALLSDEVISDWSRHALVTYQETSRSKAEIWDEGSALKPPVFNLQGCFRQAASLAKLAYRHCGTSRIVIFHSFCHCIGYSLADVLCVDKWASLTSLADEKWKVNVFWE